MYNNVNVISDIFFVVVQSVMFVNGEQIVINPRDIRVDFAIFVPI